MIHKMIIFLSSRVTETISKDILSLSVSVPQYLAPLPSCSFLRLGAKPSLLTSVPRNLDGPRLIHPYLCFRISAYVMVADGP